MWSKICILFCLGIFSQVLGSPKKYGLEEGFAPSHRYYESDLQDYSKAYKNKTYTPQNPIAEPKKDQNSKESRFGVISYGTSGNGYGSGNTGLGYGGMKIDIAGVALGALIGLGAILIIPKIASIFSGGHGYSRSIENDLTSMTNVLSRLDNSLAANNIDSASCTQRIICTFVNDAIKNRQAGEATGVDEFVLSFTNNSLFTYMLDGTAIKEAVEVGKSQDVEKCSTLYSKCPLTRDNIMKVISTLLPA